MLPQDFELNSDFKSAFEIMENSQTHVFVTGKAGTGKSTLLDYFKINSKKKNVVLAPTGVAALNVGGETIHSFFRFHPNISQKQAFTQGKTDKRKNLFKNLQTIVIDEISMVRCDLMDAIDNFLRAMKSNDLPFGGIQVICFGDLYQLSPVATREELPDLRKKYSSIYFFDSLVFQKININKQNLNLIELSKIYRQNEQEFIEILNKIRKKQINYKELKLLNKRTSAELNLNSLPRKAIVLTSTNAQAEKINQYKLEELQTPSKYFQAEIKGQFDYKSFPTDDLLEIKPGARVMMTNNDRDKRWINGSMGTVMNFMADEDDLSEIGSVTVKLDQNNEIVQVQTYTWEISKSFFNKKTKQIERKVIGSFTQLPMKLAWAVTIHKSQGKTFDQVIIDLGRGAFAPGQTYVALSRCTNLAGLQLIKPIQPKDIKINKSVAEFFANFSSS